MPNRSLNCSISLAMYTICEYGRSLDLVFDPTLALARFPEDLLLRYAMITAASADCLRGSLCPYLAWTCNHEHDLHDPQEFYHICAGSATTFSSMSSSIKFPREDGMLLSCTVLLRLDHVCAGCECEHVDPSRSRGRIPAVVIPL